jgi:hypothetical protein
MPRGKKFTTEQIIGKLREAEVGFARGKTVPEVVDLQQSPVAFPTTACLSPACPPVAVSRRTMAMEGFVRESHRRHAAWPGFYAALQKRWRTLLSAAPAIGGK